MCKLYLLCLSFFPIFLYAQNWTFEHVDFGAKPAIAIDKKDRPHIAYLLEDTPGFLKNAILQDTGFQITLIDQAYYYGPLAIAMDSKGRPAIALHHHDDEDEYIYRWDGAFWEALPVASEGHDGWDNAIAFDSQNNIHTSSIDPAQFGSGEGVEYAYFDGNVWTKESIQAGPAQYEFSTCIQVDQSDVPHLVFYDDIGDNLVYANRTSGAWENQTIANKGGMFASLVLDESNLPHISYYEQIEGDIGCIHYTYFDGENWQDEVMDTLYHVPIAFTGARNLTALAKDVKGKLHLAYSDRKVLKYATLEASFWQVEELLNYTKSDTILGAQTALAIDSRSNPHITYFELLDKSPVSGNIMYARPSIVSSITPPVQGELQIELSPNPAKEQILVTINAIPSKGLTASLLDHKGQLIRVSKMSEKGSIAWSLTQLASGVYIVQISDGKQVWSGQFLKQ
ncbi:MAG: T9SS type A sorting domain-containing protein [Bacteroidota bacterium]